MADNARERSPWSDAVAAQVRAERAAMRWTQMEMVSHSGLKRSTYMRIEKGTHIADASELARICEAIQTPLSEFFRRVEERQQRTSDDAYRALVRSKMPQPPSDSESPDSATG